MSNASWRMNIQHWMLIWTIVLVIQNVHSACCDPEVRKLRTEVNPGCATVLPPNCQEWANLSLVHVQSSSTKDSLHFIWNFNGSPSLLLARTPLDSKLNIRWDAFLAQSNFTNDTGSIISFNDSVPFYTFGWSISNVWIFDDPGDAVYINDVNQTGVLSYHTKDFAWERIVNESETSESTTKLSFQSTSYADHSLGPDGFFKISITVHNTDGYSDILPFMLHNSNNSQIDIAFNKVQMEYPQPNSKNARVGFGVTLIQQREAEQETANMTLDKIKTLDDEHAPGVFEMFRIRTPAIGANLDQSYLEWKAICYTDYVRNIANSVDVHSYSLTNKTTFNSTMEAVNSSVLMLYYGKNNFSDTHPQLLIQYVNITFGTEKDGWYNKTPDLSWTFLTGYGAPPTDYVSLLVILVLGVGLGIPALLILAAGIYILLKRLAKPSDDLLLER